MTSKQLEQILLKAKTFEPRALVLLRKHQAGEVESITQIDRMRAFNEMKQTRQLSKNMFEKLNQLRPRPLAQPDNDMVQGFYL